jgi:hypothetical protein
LPDSVVSLALFDGTYLRDDLLNYLVNYGLRPQLILHCCTGDVMLFACSGVALPEEAGAAGRHLTRFLTSARLVREFIDRRNKDDKLRVHLHNPGSSLYAHAIPSNYRCINVYRLRYATLIIGLPMASWDYMMTILPLSRPSTTSLPIL